MGFGPRENAKPGVILRSEGQQSVSRAGRPALAVLSDPDGRLLPRSVHGTMVTLVRDGSGCPTEAPRRLLYLGEPDAIIASWCGKKFRRERAMARPGFN